MGLLRLQPDQVSEAWDNLKEAIENTKVPGSTINEKMYQNVLQALLVGKMQAWVYYSNEEKRIIGVIMTEIHRDEYNEEKSLFVKVAYSYGVVSLSQWRDGLRPLMLFAQANGCSFISFFSHKEEFKTLADELGFNTTFIFGTIAVTPS